MIQEGTRSASSRSKAAPRFRCCCARVRKIWRISSCRWRSSAPVRSSAARSTPYVERRKQANYQPVYDHSCLEDVLEETYGVILYQEQVIDVAVAMAGFSRGQADGLRRAMTRKRSLEEMMKHKEAFIRRSLGNERSPGRNSRDSFSPSCSALPATVSRKGTRPRSRCLRTNHAG